MIARRLPAAGLDLLADRFDVVPGELSPERDELLRRAEGAAALEADPTVPVDAELLEAAGPQLRVVSNFAVGFDNVDLDAAAARGVVVTNTPDVLTDATAELAVTLMLAAARRVGEAERQLRAGKWQGWDPGALLGRELAGATVGIVGLGRIGLRVAELLRGFEPAMLYASPTARPDAEKRLGLERVPLEQLVGRSDFVTLHAPATPDTRHLVDEPLLEHFKPGAVLVNTARGSLVDAKALASALRDGRLSAAGLDVFEHEPEVDPELLALENVVLLPHVGSATGKARDGMARLVAENVIAVLSGKPPLTPVVRKKR